MLKKILLASLLVCVPVAVSSPANAAPKGQYIDSSSPQVIEKISDGNIVTFKDSKGTSRNYYVPGWMFSKYDLKVGTSATLFNANVIQGTYGGSYIEVAEPGVPETPDVFAVHDTRRFCTVAESPASAGLSAGKTVWYKDQCCPSTIPVVGAMSFYQKREIVVERVERQVLPPAAPAPVIETQPVPRTW
jgi:hypothetical protein